ncbi:MAG TPA: phosphate ABC transporter permease PstA [Acidimicrobiia bacterium]|jgi:phosphate transport system permease protein
MSAVPAPAGHLTSSISAGRRARNWLATVWMVGAVLVALVPLIFIMLQVVRKGLSIVLKNFPDFLTKPIQVQSIFAGGGMGPAVVGTILITGVAALIAIPLGVLAAIYLNEYGAKSRFASILRFFSDVMAGVPSVVMGLFVFTIYTLHRSNGDKLVAFGGSLALAALMLPIVIRSTEEMLKLVPNELRSASLALGCPRWRTTVSVVLPAAAAGIISGAMLAIARAAGETAPLLFTIGLTYTSNWRLFHNQNTTLSRQIFSNSGIGFPAATDRAWAAALTLIAIVMILSVAARIISSRFNAVIIAS